jgi:aspartate/methionine/tyrosine aminotransferase
VKTIFVAFQGADQFKVDAIPLYEQAIQDGLKQGVNIRALLICNPHNPLGRCYSKEALIGYMKLCKKYNIHLLVDEVYALSVYASPDEPEAEPFVSVLSIADRESYIDKDHLHLFYGFSKDLASGGLRLGCLWSQNKDLISALSPISLFAWISNVCETIGIRMLENTDWMDSFVKKNRQTLGERAALAKSVLDEYGIAYDKGATAGFFLWIDLRKFLGHGDQSKATWEDERAFRKKILEFKVFLTHGETLKSENPGFFRFCFVKEEAEVRIGLKRLKEALDSLV